jgi:drug/metabolite transporter (DMT)-like permease
MALVWGLSFSIAKMAVGLGGTPIGISFWSSAISGVCLLLYTWLRGRKLNFNQKDLKFFFLISMLGGVIPSVCFYYAASHIPAGVLAITVTIVPIATYGLSLLLKLEILSARRVTGILFGCAGILLLVIPNDSLSERKEIVWIAVACISSLCFALENVAIALRSLDGIGPIRLSCGVSLLAALILGIIGLLTNNLFVITFPFDELSWAIILISIINVTAYTLFIFTIANSGPLFASQVGFLVTLSGIFWGVFLFGEQHSSWVWGSLITMLVGLMLVSPRYKVK